MDKCAYYEKEIKPGIMEGVLGKYDCTVIHKCTCGLDDECPSKGDITVCQFMAMECKDLYEMHSYPIQVIQEYSKLYKENEEIKNDFKEIIKIIEERNNK